MSMMNYEVFEAFKSAGVDEAKARRAAEALAKDQDRFGKIEAKLDLHSWMIGFALAGVLAILVRVLIPS